VIVLDASVLIAHLDAADRHHEKATGLLEVHSAEPLGASTITLAETLVSPARAGRLVAAEQALQRLGVNELAFGEEAPARLAEMRASVGLKMPDCCVLLAAQEYAAGVASFDSDLLAAAGKSGGRFPCVKYLIDGLRENGAMDGQITPEPPSEEGFGDLMSRLDEGPVTMLNLLAFKPDGGRERYMEYGAAVFPLLEKAGGRLVFQGEASPVVLGGDSWDLVLLVEYPTRRAFLEMIQSSEYQAIAHLRTEALTRGELHPLNS
jgi:uncharacterized protein (DUF1330 family)/predicted nucleic acid-binding protein